MQCILARNIQICNWIEAHSKKKALSSVQCNSCASSAAKQSLQQSLSGSVNVIKQTSTFVSLSTKEPSSRLDQISDISIARFQYRKGKGFNLIFYWTFPSRDEMKGSSPALRRNKSATCPCRKLSSNRAPANYPALNWYPTDQLCTAVDSIWSRKILPNEYI